MSGEQVRQLRTLLGLGCAALEDGERLRLHHGDCVGADETAHNVALKMAAQGLPIEVEVHPPVKDTMRARVQGAAVVRPPLPYLERNHAMVDASEILIAAPDGPERQRSGTWATVRYAHSVGVPVWMIGPP